MTKHLFRLVWNRKRESALVIVEIFFSFVVLFAVTAAAFWAAERISGARSASTSRAS